MNHSQTLSITQVGQVPETTLHPSILVQIPSTTYPSKQLNAVAGIALVAVSMSDEGLLSKGMILTSLLSSNEPDENLDTLFEDEVINS